MANNRIIDDDILSHPYQDLGNAIVAQAYSDYIDLWFGAYDKIYTRNSKVTKIFHKGECSDNNLVEITEFFKSDLYSLITDISTETIMKMIKNEINLVDDSLKKGLTFEQFTLMNQKQRISVDKYSYNRFKKYHRENKYLDRIIDDFLLKYDNLSEYQEKKLRDILTDKNRYFNIVDELPNCNGANSHCIYISKKDKYKFFILDLKLKKFVRVFSPVTKRTSVAFAVDR